ncbi:MAG: hypothetical protein NT004_03115 [Bacteroidetes bacterium]|nr:hypothetical protein [Bacteroidota bacterium]
MRNQLEEYISDRLGKEYLDKLKNEAEFKIVKKEISEHKNKIRVLEVRKVQFEEFLSKYQ